MGRLTVLKQIAADLASQFGPDCEVVIHDLKTSEPEHSIVYIVMVMLQTEISETDHPMLFLMRSAIRKKEQPPKTIPVI